MADDKQTKENEREQARLREATPPEKSSTSKADHTTLRSGDQDEFPEPKQGQVAAAENALIGDEAVYGAQQDPEIEVVTEDVPAQVMSNEVTVIDEVPVHETYVQMDHVVLDPSSPEAVQVPDAGRGFLDLPIHALASGTPEQKLDRKENEVTPPDEA